MDRIQVFNKILIVFIQKKIDINELYVGGVRDDDKKGSRKDKVDAKYKELLNKWKEEQRKAGKNTSPGEGTRKRLRRQAEEMVKENKTIMSYTNFLVN